MAEIVMDARQLELKIIADLEKEFDVAAKARQPHESKWYRNAAFFFGRQWILYNERDKRIYTPPAPSWRVRLVINLIFPAVRITLGKLNKIKFNLICTPNTQEREDIAAARVGTKLLKHFKKALGFVIKQFQVTLIMIIFGIAFMKNYFDSTAGVEFEYKDYEPDPTPEDPEHMKEVMKKKKVGEANSIVCTPLDLYFSPQQPINLQRNEYIFDVRIRTTDYVKETYGIDVKPDAGIYVSPIQQQMDVLLDRQNRDTTNQNLILVKEYIKKPNTEFPKGRHIIYCNKDLCYYENERPYKFYPYASFPYFPTFNSIYPPSPIQHARPLQKEYNKSRSQIIEHKNLMAKGKWLIPIGCKVSRTAFTSEPGEKIYFDSRFGKPEQADIKPLPNFVWQNILQIRAEINDIFGIHDVSQAKVPSGIRSGLAISYLQEQDDSQLGPTFALMQEGYAEVGHQLLEIASKFYIEKRLLSITGREYEAEVLEFKGNMLKGNTDVEVEVGSMMPFSKVARQQFGMDLWKNGIITDRAKMLRLLEFTNEQNLYEDTRLDEANANMENRAMKEGEDSVSREWDNHAIHLQSHKTFQKDREFIKLSKMVQQRFKLHIDGHEQLQLAEMQKMANIVALQQSMVQGGKKPPQK